MTFYGLKIRRVVDMIGKPDAIKPLYTVTKRPPNAFLMGDDVPVSLPVSTTSVPGGGDVIKLDTIVISPVDLIPEVINMSRDLRHRTILYPLFNNTKVWSFRSDGIDCTFSDGHPLGEVAIGEVLTMRRPSGDEQKITVSSIDIDRGQIGFVEDILIPIMHLPRYFRRPEHERMVRNLEAVQGIQDKRPLLKDLFMTNDSVLVESPIRVSLLNGVVGSGKTRELVKDVIDSNLFGERCLITTETNESLIEIGDRLQEKGIQVLHYTNMAASPHNWHKRMERMPIKNDYDAALLRYQKNSDESNLRILREAKSHLIDYMNSVVLLTTPSKAQTYYEFALRNDEVPWNLYVDEAALMPLLNFMRVLRMPVKQLRLYGDLDQLPPYDRSDSLDIMETLDPRRRKIRRFMYSSVMKHFNKDGAEKKFLRISHRLAHTDREGEGASLVSAFYFLTASPLSYKPRMISGPGKKLAELIRIPLAIHKYRHLSLERKEKEGKAVWHVSKEMKRMGWVKFHVVATHTYLKEAWQELGQDASTVRVAQGDAWDAVLFSMPNMPTTFIDDSLFLVGVSRHYKSLFVSPVDFTYMTKPLYFNALVANGFIEPAETKLVLRQWDETFLKNYTVLWYLLRAVSYFYSVVEHLGRVNILSKVNDPYQQREWLRGGGIPVSAYVASILDKYISLYLRPRGWVKSSDQNAVLPNLRNAKGKVPDLNYLQWGIWLNMPPNVWSELLETYHSSVLEWSDFKTYRWHWSVIAVSNVKIDSEALFLLEQSEIIVYAE